MRIEVIQGDITKQTTDAIVNAANSDLTDGSGVNGAIHDAAGPELPQTLRSMGGCPTGEAVITPGFDMACDYIIHAVGPIWHGGSLGEEAMLSRCYRSCMRLAGKHNLNSIAFPALSTGVYGYPADRAIPVAVNAVRECPTVTLVRFVALDDRIFSLFQKEISQCTG